jgi:hypothetical protein
MAGRRLWHGAGVCGARTLPCRMSVPCLQMIGRRVAGSPAAPVDLGVCVSVLFVLWVQNARAMTTGPMAGRPHQRIDASTHRRIGASPTATHRPLPTRYHAALPRGQAASCRLGRSVGRGHGAALHVHGEPSPDRRHLTVMALRRY